MVEKEQRTWNKLDFALEEEGRQEIFQWSQKREKNYKGLRKSYHSFLIFAFTKHLLRSFLEHFNFMVILQMLLAGLITYACKSVDIKYNVQVSLFISPIVFPLAFSINTDFQRREKVLEDLANFKSSAMMWLFCVRDWREACGLDEEFLKMVGDKIKGMLFHLREYLLTEKIERRQFIARVIYEDLSDTNQINEKIRRSKIPSNSPLLSRAIHLLNMMCLAYERLRVIREYRSPRSIRSFTKVLIFVLPILLSPYYVYANRDTNDWSPYYISVMVSFVFSALQGVQDKLDDPFDGMSEDDIKLDHLDEWTFQSLEATVNRTYKVGRFQVMSNPSKKNKNQPSSTLVQPVPVAFDQHDNINLKRNTQHHHQRDNSLGSLMDRLRHNHYKGSRNSVKSPRYSEEETSGDDFELHPYAGVLHNIKGNTTIRRGGNIKRQQSTDDLGSVNSTLTKSLHQLHFGSNSALSLPQNTNTKNTGDFQSIYFFRKPDDVSKLLEEAPLTFENPSASVSLKKEDDLELSNISYIHRNGNLLLSRVNSHASLVSSASARDSSRSRNSSPHIKSSLNFSEESRRSNRSNVLLNFSADSEALFSEDDDLEHSSRNLANPSKGILKKTKRKSLPDDGKRFTISPTTKLTATKALSNSKSEGGIANMLKDKEIFL